MPNKIKLIISREYTTRVMKRSFLLLTFLTPLLFAALIIVPLWLSTLKTETKKHILVIDRTHQYEKALKNNDSYIFEFVDKPLNEIQKNTNKNKELAGVLVITGDLSENSSAATLYSEKQINLETKNYIAGLLNDYVKEQKLRNYNVPDLEKIIENTNQKIDIATVRWNEKGEEKLSSTELAIAIGIFSAMMVYIFILTYGSQVMNGVIQEKTNRIVEIIISSVKPFQLMMGKIIGIALVGLTQFFIWMILTLAIVGIAGSLFNTNIDFNSLSQSNEIIKNEQIVNQAVSSSEAENVMNHFLEMLQGIDFMQIIILFIVYFIGGYLLYASLFAAVGSAVDTETDTQQFTLPLTLPIIFAIYAAIYSTQNPDGPLAFWCSLIPFTSPVVMMVRLPFGVATWEILLSLVILILSFIGTTWLAGKIYRTGILMYGKKATWKELWKWIKY